MTNRAFPRSLNWIEYLTQSRYKQDVTGIFPSSISSSATTFCDGAGTYGPENPVSCLIHTGLKVIDVNEKGSAFDREFRNVLHHAVLTAGISQNLHSFPMRSFANYRSCLTPGSMVGGGGAVARTANIHRVRTFGATPSAFDPPLILP